MCVESSWEHFLSVRVEEMAALSSVKIVVRRSGKSECWK
jgi:hypothetical protein